ncbi:hypothetical protein MRB53_031461 [Persea americana]|uniref:Uncharacterized protein n=1 Tax=Persea americana TaxID=3435 RepID=A0ACC2KP57_PERAE|nr:hypothetical protein MRB53_031461 [Persea americana]
MGISFKLSKAGTRYRPKLSQLPDIPPDDISNDNLPVPIDADAEPAVPNRPQDDSVRAGMVTGASPVSPECEASFSLNLLPDGFTIGKPTGGKLLPFLQDAPKLLQPYNRESEALFSAIEYGWLPGDIFDDIPCKYLDGAIVCEVWDYRNCMPKSGPSLSFEDKYPVFQKVRLQMGMENVVMDMPSISDDSWAYRDLLEAESRILKTLQPNLCLDPNPSLDRLCGIPVSKKLNLGVGGLRQKIKRCDLLALNALSNNLSDERSFSSSGVNKTSQIHIQSDGAIPFVQHPIASSSMTNIQHNSIKQGALRQALSITPEPNCQLAVNCSQSVPTTNSEQDLTKSYSEPRNPGTFLPEKRGRCEVQPTSVHTFKKPKQEQLDTIQQLESRSGLLGTDLQWKRTLSQQQLDVERTQCARSFGQKHIQGVMNDNSQAILEGVPKMESGTHYLDPRGIRCLKDELTGSAVSYKTGVKNTKDGHHLMDIEANPSQQPQLHCASSLMHSHFPHSVQWNNLGQPVEKNPKRDDIPPKRKLSQSPRVSAGGRVCSPASSKSGEVSSYSMGTPHSSRLATSAIGMHKEKATSMSVVAVGNASVTSGHDNSLPRENESVPTKRKCTSLTRTPTVSGVGSPASVSNTNAPFSANSPSVGTPPVLPHPGPNEDSELFERFSKIEAVTKRHNLNYNNHKVDQLLGRKQLSHSPQLYEWQLSLFDDTEESKDATCTMPMSKSLLGGSINACKARMLTFMRTGPICPGNGIPVLVREGQIKLVMSETPNGTVEAQTLYWDEEQGDPFAFPQVNLPTMPNTHRADLFAAQITVLMVRTGYQLTDDQIQHVPACKSGAYSNQPTFKTAILGAGLADIPCATPIAGPSLNPVTPLNNSIPSISPQQFPTQNMPTGSRMLSPGNLQALQRSSGYSSRPQQLETDSHLTAMKQQQQHPHVQRSVPLIGNNLLGNTNMQVGNHGTNNPSNLQFLLQQRTRQQLQQPIMQRKMMAGLGPGAGMGNISPVQHRGRTLGLGNMANLSSMSNVVSKGAFGGTMSMPMGGHIPLGFSSLSPINNINQVSGLGSFNQQFRAGAIAHNQVAAFAKMGFLQNRGRAMMNGGPIRNQIDGVGGMTGNMSLTGGPMLNQTIGRGSVPQLQRACMTSMGPPKVPATNVYNMSNQQQQQIQQLQIQQPQQFSLPLHQQMGSPLQQQIVSPLPQQQMGSPLQQPQLSGLPEQVSSPLAHVTQQQMSQQVSVNAQQLSSGVVPHQMNGGNVGVGPGSPQLSSQTLGSVGSITSSPMELQCANKGSSVSTSLVGE